jgi:hypothetical protein
LLIQNTPKQHTTLDGATSYGWNTLNRAYSNGNQGSLQGQSLLTETEVFMGPIQDLHKAIEILVKTSVGTRIPTASNYPGVNIMITGYTTY